MTDIHRMVFHHFRVLLQKLNRMPAHIFHFAVFCPQDHLDLADLFFQCIIITHHNALRSLLVMMDHRVHQHIQSGTLSCGNRDHRNTSQHFRQTVQVNLHSPLFYNIHHIQCQDDRFFQLQQLQGQIQISFQGRCINYVNDHIHLTVLNAAPCHDFLDGIGSQAVDARKVDHLDGTAFITGMPLHTFHRNPGPVCDF